MPLLADFSLVFLHLLDKATIFRTWSTRWGESNETPHSPKPARATRLAEAVPSMMAYRTLPVPRFLFDWPSSGPAGAGAWPGGAAHPPSVIGWARIHRLVMV